MLTGEDIPLDPGPAGKLLVRALMDGSCPREEVDGEELRISHARCELVVAMMIDVRS